VFSTDLTVLPAQSHVHPQSKYAIPAFAFSAITGTHLPTSELAWVAGYVACLPTIPLLTGPNVEQLR